MLSDASLYSKHHAMQDRDAKQLLSSVIKKMDWTQEEQDVVMDLGCGPGNFCRKVLLPAFPNVKKIIAIDVLPDMIEFANKNNAHEKIEYYVANVEDWDFMQRWNYQSSKVISIYCFNWLKDQRRSFQNVFQLLKPGGEAAIIFSIASPFYDAHFDLINNTKWNKYLQNCDPHIPESHFKKLGTSYYSQILTEIGFNVVICEEENRHFPYPDDKSARVACYGRCGLSSYIPEELKEEFSEDIFQAILQYNGRNADGRPLNRYTALTLFLQKPKA